MQRAWCLIAAAVITSALHAQEDRTRYIPALAYGPKVWSVVRLTNSGSMPQSVSLDVYNEEGNHLPIGPTFEVEPGGTRDIRIDGKTPTDEICWARVTVPPLVEARGIVEILEGDTLEDFPREPHELSDRSRWVTFTTSVAGKYLYFLNAAGQGTVVSFCAADQPEPGACKKKGNTVVRVPVGPNQLVGIQVRRPRKRFFITESSAPGAAVLTLFDAGPGDKRFFGTKSTIQFGDAQEP